MQISPQDWERIEKHMRNGGSLTEVTPPGVSYGTFCKLHRIRFGKRKVGRPPRHPLGGDNETIERFLQLAEACSLTDLAAEFGLRSRQRASQLYHRLTGKKKTPVWPISRKKRIVLQGVTADRVRQYADVLPSVKQIAIALGIDRETVKQRAKLYDIALPDGCRMLRRPDITPEKLRLALQDAKSTTAVAKRLQTTPETIRARASRLNILLPLGHGAKPDSTFRRVEKAVQAGGSTSEILALCGQRKDLARSYSWQCGGRR